MTYPHYSYQEAPHFDGTVTDFDIEVYFEGIWKLVACVKDNFKRKNVISFPAQQAERVRITVKKTTGARYAIINEIRIYND